MRFIVVAYHDMGDSQVAWNGRRWIGDVSMAEVYDTEPAARSAFRKIAARANLQHRDRAVVVEDYGLTSERQAYHLDSDGMVTAGPLDASKTGGAS